MSMEHKAFVFDTKAYTEQLNSILLESGIRGDIVPIKQFIDEHFDSILSPYTGEELDYEWEDEIETSDVQEYVDFALTSYYDPCEDMGLSYTWETLLEVLKKLDFTDAEYCIVGKPIKTENFSIDPGRCGLGLVYAENVTELYQKLTAIQLEEVNMGKLNVLYDIEQGELEGAFQDLLSIFQSAMNDKKGIMFTF